MLGETLAWFGKLIWGECPGMWAEWKATVGGLGGGTFCTVLCPRLGHGSSL